MNRHKLWIAYLLHDLEALEASGDVRREILAALQLHWSCRLAQAIAAYREMETSRLRYDLTPFERSIVGVEYDLLAAKMGSPIVSGPIPDSHWVPNIVQSYANYTHSFWVDHRKVWGPLWKMLYHSLRGRSSVVLCALFLIGHTAAIQGHRYFGRLLTIVFANLCIFWKKHWKSMPPMAHDIVLASYPYTLFVLRNPLIVRDFAEKYGHFVAKDPYYQAVFQISCFYAFAYSGDVVRTELIASRFKQLHRQGKLIRYRPVSELLPLIPMTLRGYGFVVEAKFDAILAELKDTEMDIVVHFQFHRGAAVVCLGLGRFEQALTHIQKTIELRKKSGSFQAWSHIDERILYLAQNRIAFDPMSANLLGTERQFDSAHGLSYFLLSLTAELPRFAASPDSFIRYIINYLQKHLGDCTVEVLNDVSGLSILDRICLVVRQKYVVINTTKERHSTVSAMIETISPAVVAVDATIAEIEALNKNLAESSSLAAIARTTQTIAHDVRRPFSQMAMGLEALRQFKLDSEAKQFVGDLASKIQVSYQQVSAMLDDILHIGKRYDVKPQLVDVNEVLSEALELSRGIQNKPGIQQQILVGEDLFVYGNRMHLMRAFSNLISNAIEAMNDRGTLTVTATRRLFDDGEAIEISVHNTGSFIPADEIPAIFEPFYTKGKHGGTGLGLAIVKQILLAHKGRINCQSDPIDGTCMTALIPAACTEPAERGLSLSPSPLNAEV